MAEWQQMASAPTDGTHVLGFDGHDMFSFYWRDWGKSFIPGWYMVQGGSNDENSCCEPIFWQPLPAKPHG